MGNGEGRGAKEKEREIVITDEDLFFPFFVFFPTISVARQRTIHHENLVCRNKFKPPAASVSTIEKKILQGEDDTG